MQSLARLYLLIIVGLLVSSSESYGLIVRTLNGQDSVWKFTDQHDITYCVSSDTKANGGFGPDYAEVVAATETAANEWEAVADVNFVHLVAEDAQCANTNNNVLFNVAWSEGLGGAATLGFFPHQVRSTREILLTINAVDVALEGYLRHELGHALGFDHEHTRPEAPGACFETNDWRALTDYDSSSALHYIGLPCLGTGPTGEDRFTLTHQDKNGAACLYGPAPGFVIDPEVCDPPEPIVDHVKNVQTGTSSSPYTSVTIPSLAVSGSNPCIAVCFTEIDAASVQSVTWNGGTQSFQEVVAAPASGNSETSLWFLGNATATTSNVVVNMTGSSSGAALGIATAISGCAAGAPTLTDTDSSPSGDTGTYPLTTTADNTLLLTCTRSSANSSTWGHGSGQTGLAGLLHSGESLTSSGELKVSAGLETLTDTNAFGGDIQGAAMGIEVAVADPDTEDPTVPQDLVADAQSATSINLSWSASTDDSGTIAAYHIESCEGPGCVNFVELTTTANTSHLVSGLTASTTYRFRVRAKDPSDNFSGYSTPVEETTLATCVNFSEIGTTTAAQFSATQLTPNTRYRFRIRAEDASQNISDYSAIAERSTLGGAGVRRAERQGGTTSGGFFQ